MIDPHPLDKVLARFNPRVRIELLHIVRYFDKRIDELSQRIDPMAVTTSDLVAAGTKLDAAAQSALSHIQNDAAAQSDVNAVTALMERVASQLSAAVTPAPASPPPAQS